MDLDQLYRETIKELVKLSAIESWVVFARFGLPILRDACGFSKTLDVSPWIRGVDSGFRIDSK